MIVLPELEYRSQKFRVLFSDTSLSCRYRRIDLPRLGACRSVDGSNLNGGQDEEEPAYGRLDHWIL